MKNVNGFTLFELLFVTGLIALMALIAIPSFSQQIKEQRLVTNINKLHSVFKFARSEAAKRDRDILLDESNGNWHVTLNNEVLVSFIPTDSSISVTGLTDHPINSSGETVQGNYLVTDSDYSTTDYRLCVYVSGQSYVTTGSCS